MGRVRQGRAVDGILILDKPTGPSSNQVLQTVKRLFGASKAGHTGSLDPLATGVLPICFGEATKFSQFLLEADKVYFATFCLGIATATGDTQGEILRQTCAAQLTMEQVEAALSQFRGVISQVPSMYSALKHQGRPLYQLARQGIEVEREAREVKIHEFRIDRFHPGPQARLEVTIRCSKGTYVRSLAEDLGAVLGCGAHVISLRRLSSGPFDDSGAIGIERIRALREAGQLSALDALLLPVEMAVGDRRRIDLTDGQSWHFRRGNPVMASVESGFDLGTGELVRVFREEGGFLGLGQGLGDGRVKPHRLLCQPSVPSAIA